MFTRLQLGLTNAASHDKVKAGASIKIRTQERVKKQLKEKLKKDLGTV